MREAATVRASRLEKVEGFVKEDYEREQEILEKIESLTSDMADMNERLQDDARWAFKDAYNYYAVNKKAIDPLSLEALENKYEHYKKKNGNSFVADVMKQLRTLPILPYRSDKEGDDGEHKA